MSSTPRTDPSEMARLVDGLATARTPHAVREALSKILEARAPQLVDTAYMDVVLEAMTQPVSQAMYNEARAAMGRGAAEAKRQISELLGLS